MAHYTTGSGPTAPLPCGNTSSSLVGLGLLVFSVSVRFNLVSQLNGWGHSSCFLVSRVSIARAVGAFLGLDRQRLVMTCRRKVVVWYVDG